MVHDKFCPFTIAISSQESNAKRNLENQIEMVLT